MSLSHWSQLYQLQDWVLSCLRALNQGFYLSGGTALSRGYYDHRYSDDLDFFVNDADDFALWRDRCLKGLIDKAGGDFRLEIVLREERFGRAFLHGDPALKLEFINDVPFRVGSPLQHPSLGLLDTKENILANKISALVDRGEPKDVADIFWLCCRDTLDIREAIGNAEGKAAGIFPPLVARALSQASRPGVPQVAWRNAPLESEFRSAIDALIRQVIS